MSVRPLAVTALLCGLLATGAAVAQDAAMSQFEARQRLRAEQAQAEGRWAEAARAWEVLTLLRPDHAGYRDSQQRLRGAIDALAAQALARAAEERRRGDLDRATRGYLQVLSLWPEHTGAAEALRQIERERNERQWQGRFARNPMQRPPADPMAVPGERNVAEHAAVLAAQGELDSAIALLTRATQAPGADPALRRTLAGLLWRRVEATAAAPPSDLRATLREILRLDPQHEAARQRLRALGDER